TSREYCTVRRVRTNTPLQALTLMNDEAFFEAARALAGKVIEEVPATGTNGTNGQDVVRARAARAFRRATARTPSDAEVDRIVAAYETHLAHYRANPDAAARVLQQQDGSQAETAEAAAWTLVANALLNLDEVVTK